MKTHQWTIGTGELLLGAGVSAEEETILRGAELGIETHPIHRTAGADGAAGVTGGHAQSDGSVRIVAILCHCRQGHAMDHEKKREAWFSEG